MSEKKNEDKKSSGKKEKKSEESAPPKEETSAKDSGYKQLYRSKTNRMIAGVCTGLADYFNIDPTIVRILFVASFFAGGIGLIAYIVCWIVIPEGDYVSGSTSSLYSGSGSGGAIAGLVIGAIIVFIGLGLLLDNLHYSMFYMPRWIRDFFSFDTFFGLALIGVGIFVVFHMLRKKEIEGTSAQPGSPPKKEAEPKSAGPKMPSGKTQTLYRSRTDRKISGVCGGLGEYFNIDPTIVRIAMVVFVIASSIFPGLIIYFIMAVVIPETPLIQEDTV